MVFVACGTWIGGLFDLADVSLVCATTPHLLESFVLSARQANSLRENSSHTTAGYDGNTDSKMYHPKSFFPLLAASEYLGICQPFGSTFQNRTHSYVFMKT